MKLYNLQILRGVAALMVCCYHFKVDLNFDSNSWGEILFRNGSIGVPIFFVISGYIMVFSTTKMYNGSVTREITTFAKKRLLRIIPLYYLLTFAWMILSGSMLYFFNLNNTLRLPKSLLFIPIKDEFPILYLGWSLNYEMFFYLIFAISLFLKKLNYIFIVAFFLSMATLGLLFTFENAFLLMLTDFRNLYFITGILLGMFLRKIPKEKYFLVPFSIVSIVLFGLYFFQILPIPNQFSALVAVTIFVATFLIFDLFLNVKANSFLKTLGDISYSIYLSHPFVEIFFRRFETESVPLIILLFLIKLAVVILVSKILYELVEKKLTKYLKSKILPHY